MSTASTLLAFASALFGGVLAVIVMANKRRSLVHFFFAAGMLALAAESVFNGLSFKAVDGGSKLFIGNAGGCWRWLSCPASGFFSV